MVATHEFFCKTTFQRGYDGLFTHLASKQAYIMMKLTENRMLNTYSCG